LLGFDTFLKFKISAQGLVEAWNFNQIEAQRAFSAALVADPACSRCWWGTAYALGPGANRSARVVPPHHPAAVLADLTRSPAASGHAHHIYSSNTPCISSSWSRML